MPKGLIPLVLSSPDPTASFGSRSSVVSGPGHLSSDQNAPSRRASFTPPVSPPKHRRNLSDSTPTIRLSRPPIKTNMRRQSQQLPASLPSIPYSSAEWKKAITEIKRYHVSRRFRACSARCNEILTNIRKTSVVEPAYLIYLNFYAATSHEMCARSLAPASAYRISLLQQARAHYERAEELIRAAEMTAVFRSRSNSEASSLPSLHSPSGSVSSRAWTPDCGVTTPTSTVSRKSSLAQGESRGRPAKKKVSFELPKDKSRWSFTLPEPMIRPDSPTLGFDDEYFAAGAMRQELPELPTANRSPRQDLVEVVTMPCCPPSMPSISEGEELGSPTGSSPSTDASGEEEYPFFRHDPADPEAAQSLARYCETLASLKTQIPSHMAALDSTLDTDLAQREQQRSESPMAAPSSNRMSLGGGGARHLSGSSVSLLPRSSASSLSLVSSGDGEAGEEARSRERRARIDRLRMNGWKRKRFDASRYEELCDTVLEELTG